MSAVTPEPTVKLNGKVLQKDRDYKLTYSNNINVSKKAQVTVTGIGKYSGNATKFFEIKARKLSGETIQFPDFSYSGNSLPVMSAAIFPFSIRERN